MAGRDKHKEYSYTDRRQRRTVNSKQKKTREGKAIKIKYSQEQNEDHKKVRSNCNITLMYT